MELKIGETIRKLRREKDVTQEEFAAVIGVSAQAVSRWERYDSLRENRRFQAVLASLEA